MGSCGSTCGITKGRAKDLERAHATALRVYPGLVWARRPPLAARAFPLDDLVALGQKLESLLPVRAHVRAGDDGECDSLFLLVGLHRPSLTELVDAGLPMPEEAGGRRETYVRVAVSPHERFAVLQEVLVSCEPDAEGAVVLYEPQPGVVDRRLQHVIKGLQGALRKHGLVVLDLAAMLSPLEGHEPSGERELNESFDEPVSLWSFLFEGLSPLARRVTWVPLLAGGSSAVA
jgi:hypothetical protein